MDARSAKVVDRVQIPRGLDGVEATALGLILLPLALGVGTAAGGALGFALSRWTLAAGLVLYGLVAFALVRNWRGVAIATLLPLAIAWVCCVLAGASIDVSWDGRQYHQEAIVQLALGWNPMREIVTPDIWDISWAVWLNSLPKAPWILESYAFKVFGNLDNAKFLSFFAMAVVGCNTFAALRSGVRDISLRALISILAAASPVAISQSITTYTDAYSAAWPSVAMVWMIPLLQGEREALPMWAIALALTNGVLAKYSQIFPAALVALVFLVVAKRRGALPFTWKLGGLCAAVVVLVGFNPYVTNWIRYGDLAYPMKAANYLSSVGLGKDNQFAKDHTEPFEKLIYGGSNLPTALREVPEPLRFWASSQIAADPDKSASSPDWQLPWTVSPAEFDTLRNADPRIGGFGPLFGGLLLLTVAIAAGARITKPYLITMAVILAAALITPYNWWARYVGYFWMFPIIALAGAAASPRHGSPLVRALSFIMLAALIVNCGGAAFMLWRRSAEDRASYNQAIASARQTPIPVDLPFAAKRIDLAKQGVRFYFPAIEGDYYADHIAPRLSPEQRTTFEACYVWDNGDGAPKPPPFAWPAYHGEARGMFNARGNLRYKAEGCNLAQMTSITMNWSKLPLTRNSLFD